MALRYKTEDAPEYAGRYEVKGWSGVACWVDGWEVEPDDDTHWSGCYNRTGRLLVVMVGDDVRHVVDPGGTAKAKRQRGVSMTETGTRSVFRFRIGDEFSLDAIYEIQGLAGGQWWEKIPDGGGDLDTSELCRCIQDVDITILVRLGH